jgi:hypothetical protein
MSNDVRTVFEAYKTTTLTFDCYGTLIDWETGACRALRDIYGYSRSEVTDDALTDLFLQADVRIIREEHLPVLESASARCAIRRKESSGQIGPCPGSFVCQFAADVARV